MRSRALLFSRARSAGTRRLLLRSIRGGGPAKGARAPRPISREFQTSSFTPAVPNGARRSVGEPGRIVRFQWIATEQSISDPLRRRLRMGSGLGDVMKAYDTFGNAAKGRALKVILQSA